ncbi:hemicentin-2-like isoform X1 [Artemia franciscana]|uniref:Ig-like domain-containing protein n=1 Tax=Artemia franciscana TaxID=6661 RepID=A0AA88HGT8_ARTSF|nr:hypothetical protein QYM36_013617 [Artemia franciscana]
MKFKGFFAMLAFALNCDALSLRGIKQSFEKQATETEVNPGGTAVMDCKVINKGGSCVWQKDRRLIGIYPGKYEWSGDPEQGDCSLKVLSARADLDDGLWECQVTASTFDSVDYLNSEPARLIVRAPPSSVEIYYNSSKDSTAIVTVNSETKNRIKCISEEGNPPPSLLWFLGNQQIDSAYDQSDDPLDGLSKGWRSILELDYTFRKDDNGKMLRCVANHEALTEKTLEAKAMLNVQYVPTISISQAPDDIEEANDSVFVTCVADANPPATIIWRKLGSPEIVSIQDKLEFIQINRTNSGTYTCEAKNELGASEVIQVEITVKYPPNDVKIEGVTNAPVTGVVGGSVRLECRADSVPKPHFSWFRKTDGQKEAILIGEKAGMGEYLVLNNVSYRDQGEYFCEASNKIKGNIRKARSKPAILRLSGPPEIGPRFSERTITVELGKDTTIHVEFCAEPAPHHLWRMGSTVITEGNGKFTPLALVPTRRPSCYEAKLAIQRVELEDAGTYEFHVDNSRGSAHATISLRVAEPVPLTAVVAVITGCLVFLILITLCLLYAFRSDRWCFRVKDELKSSADLLDNGKLNGHIKNGYVSASSSQSSVKSKASDLRYSDLQLPKSSNNGSMRSKADQVAHGLPSVTAIPSPKPEIIHITNGSISNLKDKVDV